MGVAGDTGGRLPGNEKLGELGVALMKLDIIGRELADKLNRLLVVFVFVSRQPDEQFDIPRFGDHSALPFGVGEVFELPRFILFLDRIGIPRSDDKEHIRGQPIASLEIGRVCRGFGRQPIDR